MLMGDHERFISEGSDYQQLAELENRTIFNRIWSPNSIVVEREDADQLSMEATILDLLGIGIDGNRAGIGASVLAAVVGPGSLLALSPELQTEVVRSRSSNLYSLMWGLSAGEMEGAEYLDPTNPPDDTSTRGTAETQSRNLTR